MKQLTEKIKNLQNEFINSLNSDQETSFQVFMKLAEAEKEDLDHPAPEELLLWSIFGGNPEYEEKPRTKKERRAWNRHQRFVKKMRSSKSNRTFVLKDRYYVLTNVHPRCLVLKRGCHLKLRGLSVVEAILVEPGARLELDSRYLAMRPRVNGLFLSRKADKVTAERNQVGDIFDLDEIQADTLNYKAMMKAVFSIAV